MRFLVRKLSVALLMIVLCRGAIAERMEDPTSPVIPNLHMLSRSSGYIFSGTVIKVESIAPRRRNAVAVMRISFRIGGAIRGVRRGQILTIREWAGLWQTGERYRPGERVVLFLYSPSKLGLTSPVGGVTGRLRINPDGRIVVPRTAGSRSPRDPTRLPGTDLLTVRELARALQRDHEERP